MVGMILGPANAEGVKQYFMCIVVYLGVGDEAENVITLNKPTIIIHAGD